MKQQRLKLKAIIFDMDGTLANTEEVHRLAFNAAFEEFSLPVNWSVKEYAQLLVISGGRERIYQYLKEKKIIEHDDLRAFAIEVHTRKSEIYREMLNKGHLGLRSGVKRLIDEACSKKIRLAIATSSSKANVETLLRTTMGEDAIPLFESIVSCDLIGDQKPAPAIYQYALAELGYAPEDCVAIEDTSNGNRSALAAGLKTVITTHELTTDSDFSGASLVLDQLGEPDSPFKVSQGVTGKNQFVDIELLNSLLTKQSQETQATFWHPAAVACAK